MVKPHSEHYHNLNTIINRLAELNYSCTFTVSYICGFCHIPSSDFFEQFFRWNRNKQINKLINPNSSKKHRIGYLYTDGNGDSVYMWF